MKKHLLGVLIVGALTACGEKAPETAAPAETSTAAPAPAATAPTNVNVYNWSDYIAEDTIQNFEGKTKIKVTYDVFDSNEVLETKLTKR